MARFIENPSEHDKDVSLIHGSQLIPLFRKHGFRGMQLSTARVIAELFAPANLTLTPLSVKIALEFAFPRGY